MPTSNLKRLLTPLKLRQLAGAKTFERGADYFASGKVLSLVEQNGKLTATVQGTDLYHVALSVEGTALAHECTCPMGVENVFCRHCVATGLEWLANGTDKPRPKREKTAPAVRPKLEEARAWLVKQDKDRLVEIILDRAAADARFRDRLLQEAKDSGRSVESGKVVR